MLCEGHRVDDVLGPAVLGLDPLYLTSELFSRAGAIQIRYLKFQWVIRNCGSLAGLVLRDCAYVQLPLPRFAGVEETIHSPMWNNGTKPKVMHCSTVEAVLMSLIR